MTRRVTIPNEHVALVLPNELADELMAAAKEQRRLRFKRGETAYANIWGDVMLAILEAREA